MPLTIYECSRCGLTTAWNKFVADRSKLNPNCPNCHRPLTEVEQVQTPTPAADREPTPAPAPESEPEHAPAEQSEKAEVKP